MRFLVTGTAGFIGYHLARRLLDEGHEVIGLDGFTPYYDVTLKERRNARLASRNGFTLMRTMLEDNETVSRVGQEHALDAIVHLAAQAGVRYSLENPRAYIDANLVGTFNIMELARTSGVKHLMLASTSSVYGANTKSPFQETDQATHQLTLYAATKAATELMAHSYSHLWQIPTTAFRFFSVYGTWGRPDMALFKFTKGILEGTPIDIYNFGKMDRDFTYVDDLVEGIYRLTQAPPVQGAPIAPFDTLSPVAPFRVVNIGRGKPVSLMSFIEDIERFAGRTAVRNYMPMQPGDVTSTYADAELLFALTGYRPTTPVSDGVKAFVEWYREYYGV